MNVNSFIKCCTYVVGLRPQTQPIYSFGFGVPIGPLFLWWFPISLYCNYALYCKCWEPLILTFGMFTSDRVFPGNILFHIFVGHSLGLWQSEPLGDFFGNWPRESYAEKIVRPWLWPRVNMKLINTHWRIIGNHELFIVCWIVLMDDFEWMSYCYDFLINNYIIIWSGVPGLSINC